MLTGRTASKVTSRRKENLLFEVRSTNLNDPMRRWVRLDELYEIHHSQAPPTSERLLEEIKKAVEKGKMKNE